MKRAISVFLILATVLHVTNSVPILLSIYYETLCPDSVKFIIDQFNPTYNSLGGHGNEYLAVEYVPYGKANTTEHPNGTYEFECQHGPPECAGNLMHSCALEYLPLESHVSFVECSMNATDPPKSGPECAKKLGLDYAPVESCIDKDGPKLLAKYGIQTHALNPTLYWVPWLLFDNVFTEEDLDQGQENLLKLVCSKLDHSPLPEACVPSAASSRSKIELIPLIIIILGYLNINFK